MKGRDLIEELLAVSLYLSIFLPFNYFLPVSLVLLGLLRDWRVVPVVSALSFLTSAYLHTLLANAAALTFMFPVVLLSSRFRAISYSLFLLAVAFSPLNDSFLLLFLLSILFDYRASIISGITLLVYSAVRFSIPISNDAYFLLLFGLISSIIQSKIAIRREYYYSIPALVLPQLHLGTFAPLALSIGSGMFFPPALVLSALEFYLEGVHWALYTIPFAALPYLIRKKEVVFTALSAGLGWFSAMFPPLALSLFLMDRRSLLYSSVALLGASAISYYMGHYSLYPAVGAMLTSAVFMAGDKVVGFVKSHRRAVVSSLVIASYLSLVTLSFFYGRALYFAFIFALVLVSILIPEIREKKFVYFSILALLSYGFPFLVLSGARLKDRLNFVVPAVLIACSVLSPNCAYLAFFSALAYFAQGYSRLPKFLIYLPPVFVLFPFNPVRAILAAITFTAGYLIGRRSEFVGLLYEISLVLSFNLILMEGYIPSNLATWLSIALEGVLKPV